MTKLRMHIRQYLSSIIFGFLLLLPLPVFGLVFLLGSEGSGGRADLFHVFLINLFVFIPVIIVACLLNLLYSSLKKEKSASYQLSVAICISSAIALVPYVLFDMLVLIDSAF